MKRSIALLIMSVVSFLIGFGNVAGAEPPKFTKHFNESLFNITEKGLFSVEIIMDDREYPKLGKDVIGLVIHNQKDNDVVGADIRISAIPEGAAGNIAPVIKDKGEGFYTVSNLNLKKGGKWELRITVKAAGAEDSASFLFPDVLSTPLHKGKYLPD